MTQPRFGGIGMALTSPLLKIEVSDSEQSFTVRGEGSNRVEQFVKMICSRQETNPRGTWQVASMIPEHQGLGSGTQLALATGHILAKLQGFLISSEDISIITNRGRRSGIGVGSFETGGFLVDGGKLGDKPPAISKRLSVPETWRVLLVMSTHTSGLHGRCEQRAFDKLPDFSDNCVNFLARTLKQTILPALAAAEFEGFSEGLTRFQDTMGDYFLAIQKHRYAHDKVASILEYLRGKGITGIGQSSWGPTGFIFAPNQDKAEYIMKMIQEKFSMDSNNITDIKLQITQANNQGAYLS